MIATPEALLAADKVPHVAPLQPVPVSVHVTPLFCVSFVTVAVKFWVLLTLTVAAVGARATATAAVTVMDAFDVFVVSPTDVAFRVTAAGLGTLAGALYVTEVVVTFVSVPHAAPLQPVPESDHVTPLAPVSFIKVAVKFCLPMPACTFAVVGESVIEITGAVVIVTVVESDFVLSACEVAVMVTVPPVGTVVGAVYSPDALIVPILAALADVLLTCQVTVVFVVPETVAVNCCVWFVPTLAVAGATCTEIIGGTVPAGPAHAARAIATAPSRNCRTKRELVTAGLYVFTKLCSTLAVRIFRGHKRKPAGRVFFIYRQKLAQEKCRTNGWVEQCTLRQTGLSKRPTTLGPTYASRGYARGPRPLGS